MADLDALIERVRGLEGPDREVDAMIVAALAGYYKEEQSDGRFAFHNGRRWVSLGPVPKLTASLDAVVALIERELPDALWDVNGYGAATIIPGWLVGNKRVIPETGTSPTLALLLAFLTAMKEKTDA